MPADTLRKLLWSDLFVYVGSGIFAIVVFLIALSLLARYGPAGIGGSELSGLLTGFSAFMLAYFVSLGIWYYVRR